MNKMKNTQTQLNEPVDGVYRQGVKTANTFGQWEVDKFGNMEFRKYYFISRERLSSKNWILHLSEKRWIVWNDFIPAYMQACLNAGIQEVTIKMFY